MNGLCLCDKCSAGRGNLVPCMGGENMQTKRPQEEMPTAGRSTPWAVGPTLLHSSRMGWWPCPWSLPRWQPEKKGGGPGCPAGCVSQAPGGPRMHPPSTCLAQREGASGHSRARPQPPDTQAQSRRSHTDHVLQAPRVTELPHPRWIFTFGAGSLLPRARFSQVCFFQQNRQRAGR